jgi:hypothetical protein
MCAINWTFELATTKMKAANQQATMKLTADPALTRASASFGK